MRPEGQGGEVQHYRKQEGRTEAHRWAGPQEDEAVALPQKRKLARLEQGDGVGSIGAPWARDSTLLHCVSPSPEQPASKPRALSSLRTVILGPKTRPVPILGTFRTRTGSQPETLGQVDQINNSASALQASSLEIV